MYYIFYPITSRIRSHDHDPPRMELWRWNIRKLREKMFKDVLRDYVDNFWDNSDMHHTEELDMNTFSFTFFVKILFLSRLIFFRNVFTESSLLTPRRGKFFTLDSLRPLHLHSFMFII